MIGEAAKTHLHERLDHSRESLVAKLEGLHEYDVRRPMTRTGTNLLGLVKHLALYEGAYFGGVFGRPFTEQPYPSLQHGFRNCDYMWVAENERRDEVLAAYERACAHADVTIEALPIDAPGHVSWWEADVTLFDVLVHMLAETEHHIGHADVIREALDGAIGPNPTVPTPDEEAKWATHCAFVEAAARAASETAR